MMWKLSPRHTIDNLFQDPNHKVNMEYTKLFEYKRERNEALQKTAITLGL